MVKGFPLSPFSMLQCSHFFSFSEQVSRLLSLNIGVCELLSLLFFRLKDWRKNGFSSSDSSENKHCTEELGRRGIKLILALMLMITVHGNGNNKM